MGIKKQREPVANCYEMDFGRGGVEKRRNRWAGGEGWNRGRIGSCFGENRGRTSRVELLGVESRDTKGGRRNTNTPKRRGV